jgi:hypothetical protein
MSLCIAFRNALSTDFPEIINLIRREKIHTDLWITHRLKLIRSNLIDHRIHLVRRSVHSIIGQFSVWLSRHEDDLFLFRSNRLTLSDFIDNESHYQSFQYVQQKT